MLTVRYEQLGLIEGERLLDLGCGGGRHAFGAVERRARVVALDVDVTALSDVRRWFDAIAAGSDPGTTGSGAVVGGEALHLPFPDGAFDRVVAAEVLEHLPDDRAAVAELARVLRAGGTLAVTVPAWLSERVCWALADDYHAPAVAGGHLRIYTRPGLRRRLAEAGLVPTRGAHGAHALHTPYWWLRCLVGPGNDGHPLVRAYHRFLVWDMVRAPRCTRLADAVLRPLLAKSAVVYATKPPHRVLPAPDAIR
ncbi:MAG: class I SAM-dependent methyltransferase [Actinobacteria bacterium]|nr:class I SAM-dependent methyltransferase [Actinomycetota bacterium]